MRFLHRETNFFFAPITSIQYLATALPRSNAATGHRRGTLLYYIAIAGIKLYHILRTVEALAYLNIPCRGHVKPSVTAIMNIMAAVIVNVNANKYLGIVLRVPCHVSPLEFTLRW